VELPLAVAKLGQGRWVGLVEGRIGRRKSVQRTRRGLDGDRRMDPRFGQTVVEFPWCTQSEASVGVLMCASEGGGRASGVLAARKGRGGGGRGLGVRHGRRIHSDARVVRTGGSGRMSPTGGFHGPARAARVNGWSALTRRAHRIAGERE
jgi:hypothetical protein